MTKREGTVAERVLIKHGVDELNLPAVAHLLGITPTEVRSLIASGELKSPRFDPVGVPILDYASVLDYIARIRQKGSR